MIHRQKNNGNPKTKGYVELCKKINYDIVQGSYFHEPNPPKVFD